MRASTIYFIQVGDAGPIKIGFTSGCPLDRMANLQTGSPNELRLVAHARGTQEDERELHKRFAHLRMRGEWFQAKPELVEFIRGIQFAQRDELPLQQAHEFMIGDLGREDLERVFAYVHVRMVEERAKTAMHVASIAATTWSKAALRRAVGDLFVLEQPDDNNAWLTDAIRLVGSRRIAELFTSGFELMTRLHKRPENESLNEDPDDSYWDETMVNV